MGWRNHSRTLLMSGAAAIGLMAAHPALAQAPLYPPPPTHYVVDDRGVDLLNGKYVLVSDDVTIGTPGQGGLTYARTYVGDGWRDSFTGTVASSGSTYTVSLGGQSIVFTKSGTTYTPQENNGQTLVDDAPAGHLYTSPDGTQYRFQRLEYYSYTPWNASDGVLRSITYPNGEVVSLNYRHLFINTGDPNEPRARVGRLQSITNSYGYQLQINYFINVPNNVSELEWYYQITGVTGFNRAIDNCEPNGYECHYTRTWPSATYATPSANVQTVTDQSGRVTRYTFSDDGLTAIRRPSSATNNVTIGYNASGRVSSVSDGAGTWNYAYSGSTITATNPGGSTTVATVNASAGQLSSWRDELNRTTSYLYDSQGRLTRATLPEGNQARYAYDSRGNVTTTTMVPKAGSGLSNIVTSAAYPATCSNPLTCNQPTNTTDPLGNVTDYTYSATHGGVLTVTQPAPTTGAARPQTRYTYTANGVVHLATRISQCVTGTSCANGANEVRTDIVYGASGVGRNLPTEITQGSGNGALAATTTMTWNANGDVETVDGPLAGDLDNVRYRYDAARQMVGVIGPRPTGTTGPHRAWRYTYNLDGQVTLIEQGTVPSNGDSGWSSFSALQRQATAYNAQGRPTHLRSHSGSTTYSLAQTTYDARGRVECTTVRMNSTAFASPPASACTASTAGAFGPDRIRRYTYDAANQVLFATSGHGTAGAITEQFTYTDNGRLLTARDGDGNLSTWVYDGLDRISRLRFPTTAGGTSNTSDYVRYDYDAASNVIFYRTRGGNGYDGHYDALNRLTFLDQPSPLPNLTYTYDNLGRTLSVSQSGHAVSMTYDALSRLTSQTNPLGATSYQYDLAGRRTRLTWPDGFYAQYDYNRYGEVTAIRENGATSGLGVLATYAYDTRGRRTGITRPNGANTTYSYDAVSRLTSIAHNLPGMANDVTISQTWNPAGQVATRTISNDLYVYEPSNGATSYTINGRNEIATSGSTTFTYDANRNLTDDGVGEFTYDKANRILTANSHTYSYDPLGRIFDMNSWEVMHDDRRPTGVIRRSTGAVHRRFVPGPGENETVLYYLDAGTTERLWTLSDPLGSNIGYPDAAGALAVVNTFDEYGQTGPDNTTYLQFAGQFVPSVASRLVYARNRFYRPRLGRFVSPDPILYGDGLNLYAYVGNDPVNFVDPWGLNTTTVDSVTVTGQRLPPMSAAGSSSAMLNGTKADMSLESRRGPAFSDTCQVAQDQINRHRRGMGDGLEAAWDNEEALRYLTGRFSADLENYDLAMGALSAMGGAVISTSITTGLLSLSAFGRNILENHQRIASASSGIVGSLIGAGLYAVSKERTRDRLMLAEARLVQLESCQ